MCNFLLQNQLFQIRAVYKIWVTPVSSRIIYLWLKFFLETESKLFSKTHDPVLLVSAPWLKIDTPEDLKKKLPSLWYFHVITPLYLWILFYLLEQTCFSLPSSNNSTKFSMKILILSLAFLALAASTPPKVVKTSYSFHFTEIVGNEIQNSNSASPPIGLHKDVSI